MRILLTGATGFIGKKLAISLSNTGHELIFLTRNPKTFPDCFSDLIKVYSWSPQDSLPPEAALKDIEAVIHLAGEPIVKRRWTKKQKNEIYDSRIQSARNLMEGIAKYGMKKPHTFISASAIGIYGSHAEGMNLGEDAGLGDDFLAHLCRDWEAIVTRFSLQLGMRAAVLRIGPVLGREGGIVKKLFPIVSSGFAGPLGNGKQWMSWIHISDLVDLIIFVLDHKGVSGPINAVAPYPIQNKDFIRALAKKLFRPAIFPVPKLLLKLALGEMADFILSSQKVVPKKILDSGFQFHFPDIFTALDDILVDR